MTSSDILKVLGDANQIVEAIINEYERPEAFQWGRANIKDPALRNEWETAIESADFPSTAGDESASSARFRNSLPSALRPVFDKFRTHVAQSRSDYVPAGRQRVTLR
jgi:hypothetical protein